MSTGQPDVPPAVDSLERIAQALERIEGPLGRMSKSIEAVARWSPSEIPAELGPFLASVTAVTERLATAVDTWNHLHQPEL